MYLFLYGMRWNAKVGTRVSCLWWNELKHLCLSEAMTVRLWLMILPWYLSFLLAYFNCEPNKYVPIFERLHVCERYLIEAFYDIHFIWLQFFPWKQALSWITTMFLSLEDKWIVLFCLRTSKIVNLGEFVSHLIRLTLYRKHFQNLYNFPNL